MIPIAWLIHLIAVIRHDIAMYSMHAVCHYRRSHYINPAHKKWVTLAHVRCVIKAPAWWYR